MYIIYLLVLGQGCSALNGVGVDQIVSVPIPSLENITKVSLPEFAPIRVKEAPVEKIIVEKNIPEIFEKKIPVKIQTRSELRAKELVRASIRLKKERRKSPQYEAPIKKDFVLKEPTQNAEDVRYFKSSNMQGEISKNIKMKDEYAHELSNETGINHFGFEVETNAAKVSWSEYFEFRVKDELIALNERTKEMELVAKAEEVATDEVSNTQSSTTTNSYDPSDPKMLAMFNQSELDISEIIEKRNEVKATKDLPDSNDEMVLIDYKNDEVKQAVAAPSSGLANLVSSPISSAVQNVIKREMGPVERKVLEQLNSYGPNKRRSSKRNKSETLSKSENNLKNRVTLYALEADLGGGFKGEVTNFNFIPSYDNNDVKEDFSEGLLNIDYSLNGETGILRGTLVKNYFIRTTLEIPLESEYSKFEIPMITQDTLIDYLDRNNLQGFGGFYLVDLGEYLEDVDLEKTSSENRSIYEHRVLLNDDFKFVKEGQGYRYVLFIGVEPGNVNVRYLGINGQETSKITFIAPEELTYDFSQLERPVDLSIETKLQNTLGKKPSLLDMSPQNIVNFISGDRAQRVAPGKYVLNTPWKIKGSRSYFELGYLDDSIFVGLDSDKNLELPSLEFISEVMRSFQLDGLNSECLLQLNIAKPIREAQISGESERGPTAYDQSFLDEDGVFSSELSPLSRKLFVLGNEEGIYNIRIKYEDGSSDYLRTYCSPSSYLLEQL